MISFKTTWLSVWPKLLVMLMGASLFLVAVFWLTGDVKSLLLNVASALISVPLIFIFYEFWRDHSKKQVNRSVYEYAKNEMSVALSEIKEDMRFLIEGVAFYFEAGEVVIDDEMMPHIKLAITDSVKIYYDEEGEPYRLKDRDPSFYENEFEDILSYSRDLMPSIILDTHYLFYQLADFDLKTSVARLDTLMSNSFVMERLSDDKTRVIVSLMQSLKMLDGFIDLHADLFVQSNLNYDRLFIERLDLEQVALIYREVDGKRIKYEQVLDSKPNLAGHRAQAMIQVYVINPDYNYVFADLITEVLELIQQWKTVSGGFVVNYQAGRMGSL